MLRSAQQNTFQTLIRIFKSRPNLLRLTALIILVNNSGKAAMVAPQHLLVAAVLLLVSSDLLCSSSPACPNSCTCQTPLLLNCSSSSLSLVPQLIRESFTELDLSHNLLNSVTFHGPLHNLRSIWLGNNSITHLSLCLDGNYGSQYLRIRRRQRGLRTRECVSWAPALQLLSVERNQLEQLPQGLGAVKSLEVLQLSFNRITSLQMGDVSHLQHLKELHLQHNLITSLHPQIFMNLVQLKIIDLSFNMLTSLHPLIYLIVRNIGADIRLIENRWQCDCSMHNLKRQMAHDNSKGLQAWPIVCASPSKFSGRDLLQLEEYDLNCDSTEHSPGIQDLIIHIGSEILLSSSTTGTTWRTLNGQSSVSQPQTALLIKDFTEKDTGLYVCVSEGQQVVSVFNLQISKMGGSNRERRDLHPVGQHILAEGTLNRLGEGRNQQTTQSDLTLAVCLSVFITFLVAFILGVVARPCIDILFKRMTSKRSIKTTTSVSSAELRQYDNEAFCISGGPEATGTGRERRVTFSTVDFIEDKAVQYYDSVASGSKQGINKDVVMDCDVIEVEKKSGAASKSSNSAQEKRQVVGQDVSVENDADHRHNIKFESISDAAELDDRCSLLSSSSSSDSLQTKKGKQVNKQKAEFSVNRKLEVYPISKEGTTQIIKGSSASFADRSPPTQQGDPNSSPEIGEQFEFSDSGQSTPAKFDSVQDSISNPKQIVTLSSDKEKTDDTSSSSSYVSEDESTEYTVNSDLNTEEYKSLEKKDINTDRMRSTVVLIQGDERNEIQRHAVKIDHSSSSTSSVSSQELGKLSLKPKTTREIWRKASSKAPTLSHSKWRNIALSVTSNSDSWNAAAPPTTGPLSSSSSSSNSEVEVPDHTAEKRHRRKQINKHLNVHGSLPASTSSSSDEIAEQAKHGMQKPQQSKMTKTGFVESVRTVISSERWPESRAEHLTKSENHLIIKALDSDTPSQIDSDIETSHRGKRRPLNGQWQAIDLQRVHKVRRHLRVKVSSPLSDSSSSSDSESENTHQLNSKEQKLFHLSRPSAKKSQVVNHDQEKQWSPVALKFPTHGKTGLDSKKAMPSSSSSTQSESEDESTRQKNKYTLEKLSIANTPSQTSELRNSNVATEKSVINIQHIPHINLHPNIKSSSLSDSSSSSDSEDEKSKHTARSLQGEGLLGNSQLKVPQTVSNKPEAEWPAINLQQTISVKRHLNIKAPSLSFDSSSSNSQDDTTNLSQMVNHCQETWQPNKNVVQIRHTKKRAPTPRQHKARRELTSKQSFCDLEPAEHIDGHLHVNSLSSYSDSSSSTNSEEETTGPTLKQTAKELDITEVHNQKYPVEYQSENWPAINLQHAPKVKKHLDIKPSLPVTESSSSSDSDDKATIHSRRQKQGILHTPRLYQKISQSEGHEKEKQWPTVDLQQIPHIERRLNIKPTSLSSSSSSSSRDSEYEKTYHKQKQGPAYLSITRVSLENYHPEAKWFAMDLQHIPQVKRRLDIKPPLSPLLDSSSSSDSEGESTKDDLKQEHGKLHFLETPTKVTQEVTKMPKTWKVAKNVDTITHIKTTVPPPPHEVSFELTKQRTAIDQTTHVKRNQYVDAKLESSNSSSSSDSEEKTRGHTQKQTVEKLGIAKQSPESCNRDEKRSLEGLYKIPRIKRRIDIKAPSLGCDASSCNENEDDTKGHIQRQTAGQLDFPEFPSIKTYKKRHFPEAKWPTIDLQHIRHVKRRLYIKPIISSSPFPSSVGENQIYCHQKLEPGKSFMTRFISENYDPEAKWPAIDLHHIPLIERRLDIKRSSTMSDSSSSSESEDESTEHIKKQTHGELYTSKHPVKVSQTQSLKPQVQWPLLDCQQNILNKRHLDIKVPSLSFNPSSRSETEDEIVNTGKEAGEMFGIINLQSQTGNYASDAKWSALDLQCIPRIKRRLDIKLSLTASESSSSNVSEDESTVHIKKPEQEDFHMSKPPSKLVYEREIWRSDADIHPSAGLKEYLNRSSSSSSSHSEVDTTSQMPNKKSASKEITTLQYERYDPEIRWPLLDLQHLTRIKRHLDVKWSSLDEIIKLNSKEQQSMSIKVSQTVSHELDANTADIETAASPLPHASVLSGGRKNHSGEIRREKSYKSSSSQSSSSSDEQEIDREDFVPPKLKVRPHKDSRWSDLGFSSTLQVKRRLNVNNMSPSGDYHKYGTTDPILRGITSYQPATSLNDFDGSVTYESKNLASFPNSGMDFSGNSLSQKPESNSSSDSEEDNKHNKAKVETGVCFTSKSSTKELFRSPKDSLTSHRSKLDQDTKFEKYATFSDDLASKAVSDTTQVNPELQLQWATMNLSFSRFRKRLEVSSQTHKPLPSSPPPNSPNVSGSEGGTTSNISRARQRKVGEMQEITQKDSSCVNKQTPKCSSYTWTSQDKSSDSFEVKGSLKKDYSFSTTEEKSNKDPLFTGCEELFIKEYQDVKMSEKAPVTPPVHQHSDSSSSSSSSEEKEDHAVADLRHGVPRLKRRLNIKMLSPKLNTSATSSDDENDMTGHTSNWTGGTDNDSIITYKRKIIKNPSLPSNSSSSSIDMSVDGVTREITEESKNNIGVDMPPDIKWTGIGHHLSDLSSSTERGNLISALLCTETALPAVSHVALPSCSDSSSSNSDNEKKQEDSKPKSTLTNEYSSVSTYRASTSSNSILDWLDKSPENLSEMLRPVSVDKGKRKGLSALKVMSASRQVWDEENPDILGTPQNDPSLNYDRSAMDIKSVSQPPLMPKDVFSTSAYATRETDSLYSIPHYKKHHIEYAGPPQEAPPPVPATSSPEEAALLRWRSPQSVRSKEWEANTINQQSKNTNITGPILLIPENLAQFDNKNTISEV